MAGSVSNIQWFPGHMAKTRRKITECLSLCDIVAEICDARVPLSSRNPIIDGLIGEKPHVILLNKSDMADEHATKHWAEYFSNRGSKPLIIDCKSGKGLNQFVPFVCELLAEKLERLKAKGMIGRPVRAMVVGIPNVGKSSFINKMAGNSKAKVENRPGVTRGNQWFIVDKKLELLDTPGVLWPKFEDKVVGEKLAFTGAIKDSILDSEYLACKLLESVFALGDKYIDYFISRYKLTESDLNFENSFELLTNIGRNRSMVIKGGEVDTERTSNMLLEEFRAAKIGRITLEFPKKPTPK